MNDISIKVENISKLYQLGQVGTGTLHRDLKRWWAHLRGKDDPFAKIGQVNDRTKKAESEFVWALQNINFEVKKGEVLGIIGRNGAGKSTLLKILSKITSPTKGEIIINGRIASLLEVGTGFHPELSGRENIFLNGAILGMRKWEIQKKFDEIVDFAGVEAYIDTPVKRYSSGMYVRLAFAVAAFLEPEILIVDEVLAVGDAEFQKKCLGRMKDVSTNEGRTVLFVSHNMGAVRDLCTSAMMLKNGMLHNHGSTNSIISEYLLNPITIHSESDLLNDYKVRRGNGEARFSSIKINRGMNKLDPQEDIIVQFVIKIMKPIDRLDFSLVLKGPDNSEPITSINLLELSPSPIDIGKSLSFNLRIHKNILRTGLFPLYIWLGKKTDMTGDNYPYDVVDSLYYFSLFTDKDRNEIGYNPANPMGYFNLPYSVNDIFIN